MNTDLSNLLVLNNLTKSPLFGAFANVTSESGKAEFYSEIYKNGAECCLLSFIQNLILCDENAFSVTCAAGKTPSNYLCDAYVDDLTAIFEKLNALEGDKHFALGEPLEIFGGKAPTEKICGRLKNFYALHGFGAFIYNKAFEFQNGALTPLVNPSDITLEMLKDYESEKRAIQNNVEDFIHGYPYSDMLLYGERGTGKSSTVHAMLNKYFDNGLRLIELDKAKISELAAVKKHVSSVPLKFIIFIDDLSLEESDEKLSVLKSAFEGTVGGYSDNVMIIATSNRRNIVKENFSERDNAVHLSDVISEQLSLSDRFGIKIMFSTTDKSAYLSIVRQLADDCKINMEQNELFALAERWAIIKGGRSPRHATQFVNLVHACESAGRSVEF